MKLEVKVLLFNKTNQQSEISVLINRVIDTRIDLLRAELHLRHSFSGVIGGVILGVGIVGLLNRKKRFKEVDAMRGIIDLVGKDS